MACSSQAATSESPTLSCQGVGLLERCKREQRKHGNQHEAEKASEGKIQRRNSDDDICNMQLLAFSVGFAKTRLPRLLACQRAELTAPSNKELVSCTCLTSPGSSASNSGLSWNEKVFGPFLCEAQLHIFEKGAGIASEKLEGQDLGR